MKTLHVKPTNLRELSAHNWSTCLLSLSNKYYIRCNAKGEVNWDKAPLYKAEELILRNNVKIIS